MKGKEEYAVMAGTRTFNENGEPSDMYDERYIYLTEEEYRFILGYLKKNKAINDVGDRIDRKADDTQHPWTRPTEEGRNG